MPNTFAYIVLFSWPIVTVMLFRALPLRSALVWSMVAGYLLVPIRAGFDLPLLPPVDKFLVLSVPAAIMCLVAVFSPAPTHAGITRAAPEFQPQRGQVLFWGLFGLLFLTPLWTVLQNGQPIVIGSTFLPGLRLYDALSSVSQLLVALIPLLLGRRFLASEDSQWLILRALALAALAYSVLILYEVRMSPQLNTMVYGFFPHSWVQHVRGSGYRPLVFLPHGLILSIFIATAFLGALVLWRSKQQDRQNAGGWLIAGIYLFVILLFCRSLGALALGVLFAPAILFLGRMTQLLSAACIAVIVLVYPMVRAVDVVPVDTILNAAATIDEKRARSFQGRLDNEDRLLRRAQEKPLGGWGGWGRGRVYDATGRDISTTDGYWIIVIGTYGWLGYLAQFGLLCLPTILLGLGRRRFDLSLATAGMSLVVAVMLIDQIPNASIGPLTWLIAGSMMGRYQTARRTAEAGAPVSETSDGDAASGPPGSEPRVVYRRPLGKHVRTAASLPYSRNGPGTGR